MPARIRHFYHVSSNSTSVASVGTAYAAAKAHSHDLLANAPDFLTQQVWRGKLESVVVNVSSMAGGTPPATIDLMISCDADGDVILVPSTTATIEAAVTTANAGGVSYKVDTPLTIIAGAAGDSTVYVFTKADNGTFTLDNTTLVWSE